MDGGYSITFVSDRDTVHGDEMQLYQCYFDPSSPDDHEPVITALNLIAELQLVRKEKEEQLAEILAEVEDLEKIVTKLLVK